MPDHLPGRQDPAEVGQVRNLQFSFPRERVPALRDDADRLFRERLEIECRFVVVLEQSRHCDVELAVGQLREQRIA